MRCEYKRKFPDCCDQESTWTGQFPKVIFRSHNRHSFALDAPAPPARHEFLWAFALQPLASPIALRASSANLARAWKTSRPRADVVSMSPSGTQIQKAMEEQAMRLVALRLYERNVWLPLQLTLTMKSAATGRRSARFNIGTRFWETASRRVHGRSARTGGPGFQAGSNPIPTAHDACDATDLLREPLLRRGPVPQLRTCAPAQLRGRNRRRAVTSQAPKIRERMET